MKPSVFRRFSSILTWQNSRTDNRTAQSMCHGVRESFSAMVQAVRVCLTQRSNSRIVPEQPRHRPPLFSFLAFATELAIPTSSQAGRTIFSGRRSHITARTHPFHYRAVSRTLERSAFLVV